MNYVVAFSIIALLVLIIVGAKKSDSDGFLSKDQTNGLRGIAIIMVMCAHYYPYLGISYGQGLVSLSLTTGFLGVAIFLFLSGYGAMISKIIKPDYLKRYLPKRLLRLYVPFLIVFVIDILIILLSTGKLDFSWLLMMPLLSLPNILNWYLKVQLGLYILFYIIASLCKKNKTIIGLSFLFCLVFMVVGYIIKISPFWYESTFAFPFGMLFANYRLAIYNFLNKHFKLCLILSTVVLAFGLLPYYFFGGVLLEIAFIISFLCIVIVICTRIYIYILRIIGNCSLELYLVHLVVLETVVSKLNLLQYNWYINIAIMIAFFLISIAISYGINRLSNKIIGIIGK